MYICVLIHSSHYPKELSLYLNSVSYGMSIRGWLISGCYWKLWVGTVSLGFLFSQGSHPASSDPRPGVSVEAFLIRNHVNVNGFLEWQLPGASGSVSYCPLPFDGVVVFSNML